MKKYFTRWGFYLLGLLILAVGICLNAKTNLGVSPLISVAFSFSKIVHIKFANATFLLYFAYVVVEMVIHWRTKKYKSIMLDALQIPLSYIFTRFVGIFDFIFPEFTVAKVGSVFGSLTFRVILLVIAIILTGIGAALSLNARLVPNPGDGIVQAISDVWGKSVGFTKNCLDCGSVLFTCLISLIFITKKFLKGSIVGMGTLLAMIGVGRVIAVFNHFTREKIAAVSGVTIPPKADKNKKENKDTKEEK